jgi:hypothetical protein
MTEETPLDDAPGGPTVLISEGYALLIMHLWELYPGLGLELSQAVRTLRAHGVSKHHLEAGTWHDMLKEAVHPRLIEIITTEIGVMAKVTQEIQLQVAEAAGRPGTMRGGDSRRL